MGWEQDVSMGEACHPPDFNWFNAFAPQAGLRLAITLAVSLAVYSVVRAIGWVIGGFAAS
jgi:hypothetical protein